MSVYALMALSWLSTAASAAAFRQSSNLSCQRPLAPAKTTHYCYTLPFNNTALRHPTL